MTRIDEVNTGIDQDNGMVSIEFVADGEIRFAAEITLSELDRLIAQLQDTREAFTLQ